MTYKQEKLNCITVNNGIIMPPPIDDNTGKILFSTHDTKLCGVYSPDFEYINISARSEMTKEAPSEYHEIIKQTKNIDYTDETIIYLGVIGGSFMAYGNLILDAISRLWIFLENEDYKNYKSVYFSDGNDRLVFELFKLFGLKTENLVRCTKAMQARRVIIPEESLKTYTSYSEKFKNIIDKIKSQVEKNHIKKYTSLARN